jgi:magnesium-transporting ATPase (P-type)
MQSQYNTNSTLPDFENMSGRVECINPTAEIEAFEGRTAFKLGNTLIDERINKKNMILRGCKLKNTDWVIGLVIYTGLNTGIMMNSSLPTAKISKI